jgi:hypothetical protein
MNRNNKNKQDYHELLTNMLKRGESENICNYVKEHNIDLNEIKDKYGQNLIFQAVVIKDLNM